MDDGFEQETFIILKDIHRELNSSKIIALLKRIADNNSFIMMNIIQLFLFSSETIAIPAELENIITVYDIPLPNISRDFGYNKRLINMVKIDGRGY